MKLKFVLATCFLLLFLNFFAQKTSFQKFKQLSSPEKRWVFCHPFVAKKAYLISIETRKMTNQIKNDSMLVGSGNGQQVDAFRHTYWMALLSREIGWRKAKRLGIAHEKGNYKDFKKRKNEDGVIPDKISSEMDLYNNSIGIKIAKTSQKTDYIQLIIAAIKNGECKIIKIDKNGNYLDCDGVIIPNENLKGKWENNKCLIASNLI